MALTTGLFVFSKIGAQEQHVLQYSIAYTRSELADEKACSGLTLADRIISRNLEAFCVKHLLPPPENTEISFLTVDTIS